MAIFKNKMSIMSTDAINLQTYPDVTSIYRIIIPLTLLKSEHANQGPYAVITCFRHISIPDANFK
jgi:hypothetical protein